MKGVMDGSSARMVHPKGTADATELLLSAGFSQRRVSRMSSNMGHVY